MDVARGFSELLESEDARTDMLQSSSGAVDSPGTYARTKLALAGKSKAEIVAANKQAYDNKELPALEPGSMSYMMSKQAYLTATGGNLAHIMVYTPHVDSATWGAGVPNSPVILNPQFKNVAPIDVWVIGVGKWSDGTPAPVM